MPNKNDTRTKCCFTVGPASQTMANIEPTSRFSDLNMYPHVEGPRRNIYTHIDPHRCSPHVCRWAQKQTCATQGDKDVLSKNHAQTLPNQAKNAFWLSAKTTVHRLLTKIKLKCLALIYFKITIALTIVSFLSMLSVS